MIFLHGLTVDWAALAKQWITQRETIPPPEAAAPPAEPATVTPPPPPPPPPEEESVAAQQKIEDETSMDIASDDDENTAPGISLFPFFFNRSVVCVSTLIISHGACDGLSSS